MDWNELDRMLDGLERLLPEGEGLIRLKAPVQSDWRSFWAAAKQVQGAFNAGVRYPKIQDRQKAWDRFNALREAARSREDREQEILKWHSEGLRDEIVGMVKSIRYHPITELMFFFDPTTKDQVKGWQSTVREAGNKLSSHKGEMFREHKSFCFEQIQEAQENIDRFWEDHRSAVERRNREREEKQADWRQRVEANIERNRVIVDSLKDKLEKAERNLSDNQSKLDEATSEKWREIFQGWVDEAEERVAHSKVLIERHEGFIAEEERKLGG